MRTCNGNSRVEHDFAKNTENRLVAVRHDQERARSASQHDDRRLAKRMNTMSGHCFDRLLGECFDNRNNRDLRESISRPDNAKNTNMPAEWADLELSKVEIGVRRAKLEVDMEANQTELAELVVEKQKVAVQLRDQKTKRPQLIVELRRRKGSHPEYLFGHPKKLCTNYKSQKAEHGLRFFDFRSKT